MKFFSLMGRGILHILLY